MTAHRILIVDDSPEIAESLGALLAAHNYRVDLAHNGSDALRRLRKELYDIVVCDIEMPGMNGLDFLERIRRDEREQEVILMTGFLEQEYFVRAIRLGASDFISKPIEGQHLLKSIEAIISRLMVRRSQEKMLSNFDRAEFSCVIDPLKFSGAGVTKILNPILFQNLDLPHDTLSDLLTCADEMLQNAYIHGVLELSEAERLCEQHRLREIIAAKLLQPQVAARRMRFSMSLEKDSESISICVEDDGNGFDHESWLKKLQGENRLSVEAHGRGLAMLYFLSDQLVFENGGRKVKVLRKLNGQRKIQA
ncbi:MAG: response regulator [Candidatus Cloacimonadaceae bacterium]